MDAVTYPNAKVVAFINESVIPVRLPHDHKPLAEQFKVKWTPTLITLDTEGDEQHRTVGFLPPEELIPSVLLGTAKAHFYYDNFDNALQVLGALLKDYPKSDPAPEAIYLRGVCRYKSIQDPKPLKEAYEKLQAEYPKSEWAKRAYPYRLL